MWSSCPGCGARARLGSRCPDCGEPSASGPAVSTVAAALLGLTLGGCVAKGQPLYGATITDTLTDDTDTSADTGDTGGQ